ncbi:hypothetical protein AX14_001548 [Amanita brunnescens Koide BX004]|nr:hypothetical protein AX14_001548 [Amanita brunnescens Koide BX004]
MIALLKSAPYFAINKLRVDGVRTGNVLDGIGQDRPVSEEGNGLSPLNTLVWAPNGRDGRSLRMGYGWRWCLTQQ